MADPTKPKLTFQAIWPDVEAKLVAQGATEALCEKLKPIARHIIALGHVVAVFDLDKTLTSSTTPSAVVLQPLVLESFIRFILSGGHAAVLTARGHSFVEGIFKDVKNLTAITNEGCAWTHNGVLKFFVDLPKYDAVKKELADLAAASEGAIVPDDMDFFQGAWVSNTKTELYDSAVQLMESRCGTELNVKLFSTGAAIVPKGTPGKGRALLNYLEELSLDNVLVVCAGDDMNDDPMFEEAEKLGGQTFQVVYPTSTFHSQHAKQQLFGSVETAQLLYGISLVQEIVDARLRG